MVPEDPARYPANMACAGFVFAFVLPGWPRSTFAIPGFPLERAFWAAIELLIVVVVLCSFFCGRSMQLFQNVTKRSRHIEKNVGVAILVLHTRWSQLRSCKCIVCVACPRYSVVWVPDLEVGQSSQEQWMHHRSNLASCLVDSVVLGNETTRLLRSEEERIRLVSHENFS